MRIRVLNPVVQRTLSDEAADRLRSAIRRGILAPGARLVETDLAEQLGMSRIPIREAIQKLAEESLVKRIPHRGAFVNFLSRSELEEISSLRVVLEQFVVERVMSRWTPEYEAPLREIVLQMHNATATQQYDQVYEQDLLFHHTLWTIAEHSILLEVVSSLRTRISRFLFEANSSLDTSQLGVHIEGHNVLIDVLKSGDVALAQQEISTHVLMAKERILKYYAPVFAREDQPGV